MFNIGDIGIMEKKMETTIGLYYIVRDQDYLSVILY